MTNQTNPPDIEQTPGSYAQIATRMQLSAFETPGAIAQKALYVLACVLIVATIWAALTESDVCVEAIGQLVPRIRIQVIRTNVDGTIDKCLVSDGQEVKKGDTLILLNKVRAEADLNKEKQLLAILKTQHGEHTKASACLRRIIGNPHQLSGSHLALPESDRIAGESSPVP